VVTLTFVRHGKQDVPSGSFTPGLWTDPPLSELGKRQAAAVSAALAAEPVDAVLCSHLVRAAETAREVAAPHDLEPVVYPELREVETYRDVPDGMALKDVLSPVMWHGVQERFNRELRWDVSPFSESSAEFRNRVVTVVEGILALHKGRHLAIVCHGGVINAYIGHLLGLRQDMFFRPAHASMSRVLAGDGRRVIHTLNELHHLHAVDGELVTFLRIGSGSMDELGPRFERFLAAVEPAREGRVVTCEAITGGYSRISARARVRWRDGAEETFILRGDPPPGSGVFASDRDAEWELLRSLPAATSVPTPAARWYDGSGEYLGSKAIVMDCAPAASLQDQMARADDVTPLADLFVDTFAAIHRTPLGRLPARMPRPPGWGSYLDGVLARYDRMAAEHPGSAPVLQYVTWWARANQPPPVPLGLVHGDCQPSNVLVGAESGEPLVIDWEFGHVGDPREDLGYYTQIPLEPNVYWADPERFLSRYRAATGLTEEQVNRGVVDYFLIIGMAALLEQLLVSAAAIGAPERPGILASYLVNAISHQHDMFLAICDRLT
jgi:broad specificity phosphatase PhoE/aminoglycoside phosphotransferase (APT) family kinase protein